MGHNEYTELYERRMGELEAIHGYDPRPNAIPTPLSVLYASTMIAPLRRLYSWAVPHQTSLEIIAENSPMGVVEVGAGTGFWAWQLQEMGVRVAAYDLHPTGGKETNGHHALAMRSVENAVRTNPPPFTDVLHGGVEVAANHPECSLMLCWPACEEPDVPPHVSSMALDALKAYQGNTLLYVGELKEPPPPGEDGQLGQTAGPKFHAELHSQWDLERMLVLPRWPNARDSLSVWQRKEPTSVSGQSRVQASAAPVAPAGGSTYVPGQKVRQQVLQMYETMWQDAAVAHMLARVRAGGPGAREGTERAVLEAVHARANFFKRMMLRVLRA